MSSWSFDHMLLFPLPYCTSGGKEQPQLALYSHPPCCCNDWHDWHARSHFVSLSFLPLPLIESGTWWKSGYSVEIKGSFYTTGCFTISVKSETPLFSDVHWWILISFTWQHQLFRQIFKKNWLISPYFIKNLGVHPAQLFINSLTTVNNFNKWSKMCPYIFQGPRPSTRACYTPNKTWDIACSPRKRISRSLNIHFRKGVFHFWH